jgi:ketosteroid isomerase-like protein
MMTLPTLAAQVSACISAMNASDIEALMATFAEDALVNDHRNEFANRDVIRN